MPEGESRDDVNSHRVSGEGNIVAGRDINITTGVDPGTHAEIISQNASLKRSFGRLGLDPDSDDFDAAIDKALEDAREKEESDSSFDSEELLGLGFASFHRGRNSRAEGYFRESLKMFDKSGDMHGKGTALGCLGTVAQRIGEYDEARELFGESLRIGQDLEDKYLISSGLGEMGMTEFASGNFAEAEKLISESLAIKNEDPEGFHKSAFAASLNNLGLVYQNTSRLKEAEELYSQSLEFKDTPASVVTTMMNIASIRLQRGDLLGAAELHLEGLGICREEGLRFHEGGALKNIGDVFFEMNDYETARDHYIESLVIMEETGNRLEEARTRINLANALVSLDDLSGAERELTLSEKTFKELRSSSDRYTLNMAWTTLHFYRKEFAEAKERLEKILSEVGEKTITAANCKYNLAVIALMYDHEESENLLRESLILHEELGISKPRLMVSLGYGDPSEEWDYPPDNWEEALFGKSP